MRNAIVLALAALALCLSPASAQILDGEINGLSTTTWTDGVGDWFTPDNWDNGVPDSSLGARVNNGGTAQIGVPDAASSTLTLGLAASDSGTVTVDGGGTLNVSLFDPEHCSLCVGSAGTGTLDITNGGTVNTVLLGQIAELPGSTGTVTVDGAGSAWTVRALDVGLHGTGRLNVTNGGAVNTTGTLARAEVGRAGLDDEKREQLRGGPRNDRQSQCHERWDRLGGVAGD
jgi:T5SS/PEP-CTERM-associated repeat protein